MMIFHIANREDWERAGAPERYEPTGYAAEGFIHFSTKNQVADTANRIFSGRRGLVLICVKEDELTAEVRYENLEGGETLFPHLYGKIDSDAVVAVVDFPPGSDGRFELPAELQAD